MSRVLIIAVMVACLAGAAGAELPARGNVGLYADATRTYNAYCQFPPGHPIAKVDLWVWCQPSVNGLLCADFGVSFPSNVMRSGITYNTAIISTGSGDLATGYSVCLNACQWDWCWIAHQILFVNSAQATTVDVVPHQVLGVLQFTTCAQGNATEPCLRGTSLYLNSSSPCVPPDLPIATEEPTWGTLKSLFNE